jgi:hypothetical protein
MNSDKDSKTRRVHEGTGAKGGRKALTQEEQQPMGIEPDSIVDEKLRDSKRPLPGGLNQNSIPRNA